MKYYEIISNGYDKRKGVLYVNEPYDYPIVKDGQEVEGLEKLVFELRDGEYAHFHMCVGGANVVDEELKKLFEQYCNHNPYIEFLPIKVNSDKYGERLYYIVHFKDICDVIDKEHTMYLKGETYNCITRLAIEHEKAEGLHVFNSRPAIQDVIVSEDVYKEMRNRKLDQGIEFCPLICVK